jgi:hypothetical protein
MNNRADAWYVFLVPAADHGWWLVVWMEWAPTPSTGVGWILVLVLVAYVRSIHSACGNHSIGSTAESQSSIATCGITQPNTVDLRTPDAPAGEEQEQRVPIVDLASPGHRSKRKRIKLGRRRATPYLSVSTCRGRHLIKSNTSCAPVNSSRNTSGDEVSQPAGQRGGLSRELVSVRALS